MIRRQSLWLILAGMVSITTLTAMADPCYDAWLQAYTTAYNEYTAGLQDCAEDHLVMGAFITGEQWCIWEVETDYGQAIDEAADEYEDCVRNRD